jgi:transcription-repair coupling factor (superfamily II helicase)
MKAELADRFGNFPQETDALFMETEVRCLAEIAGFDAIETKGQSLRCRIPKKPNDSTVHYHRLAGQIPRLSSTKSLLKLKEVIRFLKIHIHGKK